MLFVEMERGSQHSHDPRRERNQIRMGTKPPEQTKPGTLTLHTRGDGVRLFELCLNSSWPLQHQSFHSLRDKKEQNLGGLFIPAGIKPSNLYTFWENSSPFLQNRAKRGRASKAVLPYLFWEYSWVCFHSKWIFVSAWSMGCVLHIGREAQIPPVTFLHRYLL